MISSRLFFSLIFTQIILGTLVPGVHRRGAFRQGAFGSCGRWVYFIAALLVQVGIFVTRWNVVIAATFSKSLRGLTV